MPRAVRSSIALFSSLSMMLRSPQGPRCKMNQPKRQLVRNIDNQQGKAENDMTNIKYLQKYSTLSTITAMEQKCQYTSLPQASRDYDYFNAIKDLNDLQSNTKSIALAKYNNAGEILPLFRRQLELSGLKIADLDMLNIIHIAGTKGKGSTSAFIESILRNYNLKTGFYNSPHLVRVTERIRLNGLPIDDNKFAYYFRKVYNKLKEGCAAENVSFPTYFSFLTILAFHTFLEEKIDCGIIEVGIGGEFDPTNVVEHPVVCGITTLDYDHTSILGKTIEKIAFTKAGIAKPKTPIFTVKQYYDQTIDIIKNRANEKSCQIHVCNTLQVPDEDKFKLGIDGEVQYLNASLACQLSYYWLTKVVPKLVHHNHYKTFAQQDLESSSTINVSDLPIEFKTGLQACQWQGRCQIIERRDNLVFFLDGAHTRSSMANCRDWFWSTSKNLDPNAVKILTFNVIGIRDKREVMLPLLEKRDYQFDLTIFGTNKILTEQDTKVSDTFINLGLSNEKSIENAQNNAAIWKDLLKEKNMDQNDRQVFIRPTTSEVVEYLQGMSDNNPQKMIHVLVTGSLHFVGAVMETLQRNNK